MSNFCSLFQQSLRISDGGSGHQHFPVQLHVQQDKGMTRCSLCLAIYTHA